MRIPISGSQNLTPLDFIKTAKDLVAVRSGKPRQSNLRRAVSTAYYALFHCLAQGCADLFVGGTGSERSKPAWYQVYRALEHGAVKNACQDQKLLKRFPKDIEDFANTFVSLQMKRHEADYDPAGHFYKSEVKQDIADAEDVIARFGSTPIKDRRAFAALVLFRRRR